MEEKKIKVKDGKFAIKRFNPLGETVKLVAIDKYGNKSKPKTVKIIVDSKDTEIAEKLEPLNPSMIKTKANNNRVALIVGIEKYEDSQLLAMQIWMLNFSMNMQEKLLVFQHQIQNY